MGQRRQKSGILVVDDEHSVRVMVELGLEQSGLDVWVAANGRHAVDLYRKNQDRIAVVLLDVCMPDLDGPATLQLLREQDPNVLACFMSSNTGVYTPEDLIRCGAAHVIAKPFRLDEMVHILRAMVSGVPAEPVASSGAFRP